MGELFEQYSVAEQTGSAYKISNRFPSFYISNYDEVYCYTGVLLKEGSRKQVSLEAHPYYMHNKHSTNKKFSETIKGFFRIASGCIFLDNYVDNQPLESSYKEVNAYIEFPVSASIYYGVHSDKDDVTLTKAVFGLTYNEIKVVLEGYAKTLGIYNDYIQYPRLTRSVKSSNFCDITGI